MRFRQVPPPPAGLYEYSSMLGDVILDDGRFPPHLHPGTSPFFLFR